MLAPPPPRDEMAKPQVRVNNMINRSTTKTTAKGTEGLPRKTTLKSVEDTEKARPLTMLR